MSFSEPKNFPSGWGVEVCSNVWAFDCYFLKLLLILMAVKWGKKNIPLLKEICNTESSRSEPKNKNERVQWLFVRMSEESVAWKF